MIWKDRLVKIEDGVLHVSAKGRHDDFDFLPEKMSGDQAFAMSSLGGILKVEPLPDGRLLLTCSPFVALEGDVTGEMKLRAYEP